MRKFVLSVFFFAAATVMLSCDSDEELIQPEPTPELRTGKQLQSFNFLLSENPIGVNVIGDIDEENHTVFVVLPGATLKNALLPDISVSDGASFAPKGLTDFNSQVTITVTAEDGSAQDYEVSVVTEKDALVAIYQANPGNRLGWNIIEPDLTLWEGVTMENGAIIDLLIHNSGLTEIPSEIGYLRNLVDLGMHMNEFPTIPEEIGQLKNLIRLSVGLNSELNAVPSSVGALTNLRQLHIDNNPLLTEIPAEIGNLTNLIGLYINGNGITIIPSEVCALETLYGTVIYTDAEAVCEE